MFLPGVLNGGDFCDRLSCVPHCMDGSSGRRELASDREPTNAYLSEIIFVNLKAMIIGKLQLVYTVYLVHASFTYM